MDRLQCERYVPVQKISASTVYVVIYATSTTTITAWGKLYSMTTKSKNERASVSGQTIEQTDLQIHRRHMFDCAPIS